MANTEYQWDECLKYFISRIGITLRDVSEIYHIPLSTVTTRAARNNWVAFKRETWNNRKDLAKCAREEYEQLTAKLKGYIMCQTDTIKSLMRQGKDKCVEMVGKDIRNKLKILIATNEIGKRLNDIEGK